MSFDWQTGGDWDDWAVVEPDSPPKTIPRWLIPFIILCVVVFGSGRIIFQHINQRVEGASANVTQDVTSSLELVRTATQEKDIGLFVFLLSARNSEWADRQQTLFKQNLLFEREAFGWQWRPKKSELLSLEISPDLTVVTASVIESYDVDNGNGFTETIQLQHDETYRLGEERWLWSPNEALISTRQLAHKSQWLTLSFPAQDEELGKRLALDLNTKIGELCRQSPTFYTACLENLHLLVSLTLDPPINIQTAFHLSLQAPHNEQLILPAPTTVGRPIDEAGYQALFRAYARPILTTAMKTLTGYQCCEHLAFSQAINDKLLTQLNVQSRPLLGIHFDQMLKVRFSPSEMQAFWDIASPTELTPLAKRSGYALVDFVVRENSAVTLLEMQLSLRQADDYWQWVSLFIREPDNIERNWIDFIAQQQVRNQLDEAPDESLILLCPTPNAGMSLIQYTPDTRHSTTIVNFDHPNVNIHPLPQGNLLIIEAPHNGESISMHIYQANGEIMSIHPDPPLPEGASFFVLENQANSSSYLRFFLYQQNPSARQMGEINLDQCDASNCPLTLFPEGQRVLRSPDSLHALILVEDHPTIQLNEFTSIQLADSQLNILKDLGRTMNATWQDNSHIFYRDTDNGDIVQLNINDSQTSIIFQTSDLIERIPARPSGTVTLLKVAVNPHQPDQFLATLHVSASNLNRYYLFLIEQNANSIQLLHETDMPITAAKFSPNGRYAALIALSQPAKKRGFVVVDLQEKLTVEFNSRSPRFNGGYHWSNDNQWLVLVDEYLVGLYRPENERFFAHLPWETACMQAAWQ
ncbi:MAG: hypothetical protein GY796_14980 [Chloroflexi bacterium]|nr:hypothetical protein [Chloroflexota bacterium]